MRIIKEIPLPDYKVTIYHWNNRYLIKLEQGFLEQTFKIDQFEISSEEDILKIITDEIFLEQAMKRFAEMAGSLNEAVHRANETFDNR